MTKKINIKCKYCGSEDVLRDAWASWDFGKQEWVLNDVFDAAHCNTCEGETSLIEEEVSDDDHEFHIGQKVKIKRLPDSIREFDRHTGVRVGDTGIVVTGVEMEGPRQIHVQHDRDKTYWIYLQEHLEKI